MTKSELAIHGGQPVRTQPWPSWPQWDETERANLLAVLERGEWGGYDTAVAEFETAFAARHAAQFCVTTVNGTTTLETALRALNIGPGDEVIVCRPTPLSPPPRPCAPSAPPPSSPTSTSKPGISQPQPSKLQSATAPKR